VNDVRTVDQLERVLRAADSEPLEPARLAEIRTRGRRRRRIRLAGVAVGTAAAVVAASVSVAAVTGTLGDRAQDDPPVAHETPHELSALARRTLAEIPGAVQVSSWQVVIPRPGGARDMYAAERVPSANVEAGPVAIGARWYTGVTTFRKKDFPAWLYDGVADYEEQVLGDGEGHPIGSTDIGVIVDAGPMRLACMRPLAHWSDSDPTPGCFPAMLSGEDGHLAYQWGMGTDDFLQPGTGLELFQTDTYTSGSPGTVWIGGTDGTDVATVDLVTTDGETVAATVAPGTLVPGETMFWGVVEGELAKAVTRDAAGNVLEDHEVKPCSDPVDCEVR
jgi:hypothetical protein